MPVIGGIGDILALVTLVREVAAALDGSRGSKAEYQEAQRELKGAEEALLHVHQLWQARRDDDDLNGIFQSTETRAADCQKCIEVFSKQTVKFDRSLGVGEGGYHDVVMKVRWQMSKKEEVARFRAELAQHISYINVLLSIANIRIERTNQKTLETKLENLDGKLEQLSNIQDEMVTKVQDVVESGNTRIESALTAIQSDLKLGWLRKLGTEVKGIVSQMFLMSGTTLLTVQRIEERLPTRSEQLLIRTFILEDVLGRITPIDMDYVSSWDALDGMLAVCFVGFPGHKKVAKKDYVFQDQTTNKELQRSIPWSGAFLPGQHINMGLIFRKRMRKAASIFCPGCHKMLNDDPGQPISCKCGMSHERRTQILEVEEEDTDMFDMPDDASSSVRDRSADSLPETREDPPESLSNDECESSNPEESFQYEDMSCFKRIIVIEVEVTLIEPIATSSDDDEIVTIPDDYTTSFAYSKSPGPPYYYPSSGTSSPAGSPSGGRYLPSPRYHSRHAPGSTHPFSPRHTSSGYYATAANVNRIKGAWAAPPRNQSRRQRHSDRSSYGDSDEDELEYVDFLVDGIIYRVPARRNKSGRELPARRYIYESSEGSTDCTDDPADNHEPPPRRRREAYSTPPRPSTTSPQRPPPTPKSTATEADAKKHRIPPGYSLINWDPSEEPIMLLGSVFDANSLGKWIYDWTVYHHGPATPIADFAGELWLLMIQLAGKVKRAEECMPRIRTSENREMVDDFIETSERVMNKLKKLLKSCETPMLRAGEKHSNSSTQLGKNAGTEFVDSIFGRDRQLEATEKFMASLRLWNLRFDANCEDILRRPGQ